MKEGVGVREVTETLTEDVAEQDASRSRFGKAAARRACCRSAARPRAAEINAEHAQGDPTRAGRQDPRGAEDLRRPARRSTRPSTSCNAMLAAMYAAENNAAKALEQIKIALEKEPANVDYQVLQAELMMETGDKEGAQKILDTVDIAQGKESRGLHQQRHQQDQFRRQGPGRAGGRAADQADRAVPQRSDCCCTCAPAPTSPGPSWPRRRPTSRNTSRRHPPTAPQMADAKKLLDQLNKK